MCKFFDPQNDWLYFAFASFNLWNINGLGFRVEMPIKFCFTQLADCSGGRQARNV